MHQKLQHNTNSSYVSTEKMDYPSFKRYYDAVIMPSKTPQWFSLVTIENYKALELFHTDSELSEVIHYFNDYLHSLCTHKNFIVRIENNRYLIGLKSEYGLNRLNHMLDTLNSVIHTNSTITKLNVIGSAYISKENHPPLKFLLESLNAALINENFVYKNISLYTKSLNRIVKNNVLIVKELLLTVGEQKHNIVIHYQPIVAPSNNTIIAYEALARLKLVDGTLVSPFQFITLAEKYKSISLLSPYIINEAMAGFRKLLDKSPNIQLNLNISAQEFNTVEFVEKFEFMREKHKLKPKQINLELTESLLSLGNNTILEKLTRLKSKGYSLSIDDFGTGYSNLSTIIGLPVDTVKIDKSLIKYYNKSADFENFLAGLIFTFRSINKDIVVEGIENIQQYNYFKERGIDKCQGYYIDKPLPLNQIIRSLSTK